MLQTVKLELMNTSQIPEEAVDAAARAMSANWKRMHTNESMGFQRMLAEYALEAAAPHLLPPALDPEMALEVATENYRQWLEESDQRG